MPSSCTDVCEAVMAMLLHLGFDISTEDENHDDMLAALAQCQIMRRPTIADIEAVAGPANTWKGECHYLATVVVNMGVFPGSVVERGLWIGSISPQSIFAKRPIVPHSWVRLANGKVADPTRWEIEGKSPYLYVGDGDMYDPGAETLSFEKMLGDSPEWNPNDTQKDVTDLEASQLAALVKYIHPKVVEGRVVFSINQLFWLANCPRKMLGQHTENIYAALTAMGCAALIPLDRRNIVENQRRAREAKGA